jgi:ubiquitin C-terminal hydrolase
MDIHSSVWSFISPMKEDFDSSCNVYYEDSCNIHDCFKLLIEPEVIGQIKCSKCKVVSKLTKYNKLFKLPPVLIIHFKRYKRFCIYVVRSKRIAREYNSTYKSI